MAESLDAKTLTEYEALRESKGGVGVGQLDGDTCTACRMSLPAERIRELTSGPDVGDLPALPPPHRRAGGRGVSGAVLRTDGGSRGNPGPAGAGFVIEQDGAIICRGGRFLGSQTNNVAEYEALIWGLENVSALGFSDVTVFADSELLVKQINGQYRVKNEGLKPLFTRTMQVLRTFGTWKVAHVAESRTPRRTRWPTRRWTVRMTVGNPACGPGGSSRTRSSRRNGAGACTNSRSSRTSTPRTRFVAIRASAASCTGTRGTSRSPSPGTKLDEIGIVYDFKSLKDDLGAVLDDYDHAYLNDVPPFDVLTPTAENLARVIYERLAETVDPRVHVVEVAVWESPIAKLVYRP